MKILALRGRNIASLAAHFEVDFRREPLASAGLFAICGPTGSGKSTLLDALCLALYDDTPRLDRATGHGVNVPDVGEHTISPQDPRNLLRRGTAEGYAEVEFAANDGEQYRARWAVRRARGRVDGRLQASEMTLVRLADNQPVGSLKTEVLAEIQRHLGLDFGQFTRAVLLAQNEFTAFLQADDNARAALLEQLTGTDIYARLSSRAYRRGGIEQEALAHLEQRLGDVQPLDSASRTLLESDAREARDAAARLDEQVQRLDEQLRWYGELDAARRQEDEARAAEGEAARQVEEAASRRALLARVESVQPAAARVSERDRTAGELRMSRDEAVPRAEHGAAEAAVRETGAAADLDVARAAVLQAERALRDAAPRLQHATQLDLQLRGLEDRLKDLAAERDRAASANDEAHAKLTEARGQREACANDHQLAGNWLDAHADRRTLAESWARWDTLFRQAANAASEAAEAGEGLDAAERSERLETVQAGQAAGSRREAEEGLRAAARALDAADTALAAFDAVSIASERITAFARRDALAAAERLDARLAELRERELSLEQTAEAETERIEQATRAVADIDMRKLAAEAARDQAERAEDEARQACAKNVEKLREALEPGRPCPVCGATDHPYSAAEHALDKTALRVLKRQLKECRERVDALTAQAVEQRAAAGAAANRRTEIARELHEIRPQRDEAERLWQASSIAAETSKLPGAIRRSWFTEHLAAETARLRELNEQESRVRAASEARERERRALDRAREALQETVRVETDARSRLQLAQSNVTACRDTLRRAQEQREVLLRDLDVLFAAPDWRAGWHAGPEAFRLLQEERGAEYRDRQESLRFLADRMCRLDVEIEGLAKEASNAADGLRRVAEAVRRVDDQVAAGREERKRFFDGRPVAAVRQELESAIESCRSVEDARARALAAAREAKSAVDARLAEARRVLDERRVAADDASAALDGWLARHNALRPHEPPLDVAALRDLLAQDAAWIDGERRTLEALDRGLVSARSVLEHRTADREAIERRRPTGQPAEVLRATRAQAAEDLRAATRRRYESEVQLHQDDERHRKVEELGAQVERQKELAALWAQMSDLIGSADGKKFRNYAQQLTLDVLLDHANRHLSDLARRYRLQRLPDKLALIVVDRDMADEVRSVYSLSGGESFLVSLALALGLASLSANRVRVESLFIDEGFGALDAETLSVAMDALDRLHAQGRKVGVISHVQDLAERIGTQVRVDRESGGRSQVVVVG